MKIIDPQGKWYRNLGQFVFVDPENSTRFEPDELTKATETRWVKSQEVLVEVPDPTQPEPVVEPEPTKTKK